MEFAGESAMDDNVYALAFFFTHSVGLLACEHG